jgi:hypothetical protein
MIINKIKIQDSFVILDIDLENGIHDDSIYYLLDIKKEKDKEKAIRDQYLRFVYLLLNEEPLHKISPILYTKEKKDVVLKIEIEWSIFNQQYKYSSFFTQEGFISQIIHKDGECVKYLRNSSKKCLLFNFQEFINNKKSVYSVFFSEYLHLIDLVYNNQIMKRSSEDMSMLIEINNVFISLFKNANMKQKFNNMLSALELQLFTSTNSINFIERIHLDVNSLGPYSLTFVESNGSLVPFSDIIKMKNSVPEKLIGLMVLFIAIVTEGFVIIHNIDEIYSVTEMQKLYKVINSDTFLNFQLITTFSDPNMISEIVS